MTLVKQPFGEGAKVETPITSVNVGTANTGVTVVEYGDAINHLTVMTVESTLPAIAGGAALGVGTLLYTLPAGVQHVKATKMSMAITQTEAHITADTPVVGIGSVIASGVVSDLVGTSTFEDYLTGQVAANCNGGVTTKTAIPTAGTGMVIESAGAKTIYFNVADTWAASGDAAAIISGTVIVEWTQISA